MKSESTAGPKVEDASWRLVFDRADHLTLKLSGAHLFGDSPMLAIVLIGQDPRIYEIIRRAMT
jgi:hypothetical protein